MKNDLVIDFNTVFSSILNIGNSLIIFILNIIIGKFRFIAPEYMYLEISKHTNDIATKTNFSLEDAQEILKSIIKQITFIPDKEFIDKIEEARKILKGHEKDAPYLALALTLNCNILSGDKIFKKLCPDKVRNPKEILNTFYPN